jgi:hypothetical protein
MDKDDRAVPRTGSSLCGKLRLASKRHDATNALVTLPLRPSRLFTLPSSRTTLLTVS